MFRFTRENENVFDKPHVSIKIGTGCPAGCDCDFSIKKLKKNILYNPDTLIKNIMRMNEVFSSDFEVFFVGLNLLKHEQLDIFIQNIVSSGRKFKLQISHDLDRFDRSTLLSLSQKYGDFYCSIPKTIDKKIDIIELIETLKFLRTIQGLGKVYFDIFLNIDMYTPFIDYVMKNWSTIASNNPYNCIIGEKFDIKFHDLSWKLNHTTKKVDFLKRKDCLMKDYFLLESNDIFLCDHIEVGINGDMVFHDNLCYLGNFAVSNIYKQEKYIYQDFIKYKEYIEMISKGDLKQQCYTCIKNHYSYEKSFGDLIF